MLTRIIQGNSMLFYDEGKLVFTIEETETSAGILMCLDGDLTSEAAHHIQDELDAFTTVGVKVIMDFKSVSLVAPSVLYALLNVQQLIDHFHKGAVVLKNIPDAVYREMDDTGITDLLMIED